MTNAWWNGGRFVLLALAVSLAGATMAHGKRHRVATPPPDETAPETYAVAFETTKGTFVVEVHRQWAPRSADRFYTLVRQGFFTGNLFWSVRLAHFVKFGLHGNPEVMRAWSERSFEKEEPDHEVELGDIFMLEESEEKTSATEVGIRTGLEARVEGVAPFGHVVEGLEVLDHLDDEMQYSSSYSKMTRRLVRRGDSAVRKKFKNIDSIVSVHLVDRPVEGREERSPRAGDDNAGGT